MEVIQKQVHADESLYKIMLDLDREPNPHLGYMKVQDRLMFKGRLVLPKGAPIITTFLKE